jgi:thioesterase domain-containing protein
LVIAMDATRKAAIIAKARRALESKRGLIEDYEKRRADDVTMPVALPRVVYKRHENAKQTPLPMTVNAEVLPPDYTSTPTDDWAEWVNDRIEATMMETMRIVGSELGKLEAQVDARIQRLTEAVEALRDELRSRASPSKAKAISLPHVETLPPWSRSRWS